VGAVARVAAVAGGWRVSCFPPKSFDSHTKIEPSKSQEPRAKRTKDEEKSKPAASESWHKPRSRRSSSNARNNARWIQWIQDNFFN
jgi:hypothetical protein